jgi:hypothetical protein
MGWTRGVLFLDWGIDEPALRPTEYPNKKLRGGGVSFPAVKVPEQGADLLRLLYATIPLYVTLWCSIKYRTSFIFTFILIRPTQLFAAPILASIKIK